MRTANWIVLALTTVAVGALMYGMSFPGEPSDAFFISVMAMVPLFVIWCIVGIVGWTGGTRRDRAVILAGPALVLVGVGLSGTHVPLKLHWWVARPAFERALAVPDTRSIGPVAGYPAADIFRDDNFVDFCYRNDMNGSDCFAYSTDGTPPQTKRRVGGESLVTSVKRLGAHWFALERYHTMN